MPAPEFPNCLSVDFRGPVFGIEDPRAHNERIDKVNRVVRGMNVIVLKMGLHRVLGITDEEVKRVTRVNDRARYENHRAEAWNMRGSEEPKELEEREDLGLVGCLKDAASVEEIAANFKEEFLAGSPNLGETSADLLAKQVLDNMYELGLLVEEKK